MCSLSLSEPQGVDAGLHLCPGLALTRATTLGAGVQQRACPSQSVPIRTTEGQHESLLEGWQRRCCSSTCSTLTPTRGTTREVFRFLPAPLMSSRWMKLTSSQEKTDFGSKRLQMPLLRSDDDATSGKDFKIMSRLRSSGMSRTTSAD